MVRDADDGRDQEISRGVVSLLKSSAAAENLHAAAAVGAMHESARVRAVLLHHMGVLYPTRDETHALAKWLTHDFEDRIAFQAIRTVAALGVTAALPDLILIVGRPSQRLHNDVGRPVGMGHALVLDAITALSATRDSDELRRLEDDFFPEGERTDSLLDPEPEGFQPREIEASVTRSDAVLGHQEVCIPAGKVQMGLPVQWLDIDTPFDWSEGPNGSVFVRSFYIDEYPVSCRDYDAFSDSVVAREHRCCHPAEPPGKDHRRNTRFDSDLTPDHPATGIDWFDAYAYARSKGRRLPTEYEWQRAAQGSDGRAFPWGPEYDDQRLVNGFTTLPLNHSWDDIKLWRASLALQASGLYQTPGPEVVTHGGRSPFGVCGLSGNVWEWTASSYQSGKIADPGPPNRDALEKICDSNSYVVIKGGAWTSLPQMLSPAFRGRDLLYDRHCEIGMRTVRDT